MGKEINRRQFICGLGASLVSLGLAGCSLGTSENNNEPVSNQSEGSATVNQDTLKKLVVAEGTDPDALIQKGLSALGGIGLFVKNGSSVVIKPNFSVPRKPEEAATTNPQLVAAVVKECLTAGAKEVKVIDYAFSGPTCLITSGIKEAVEAAGGKAFNIDKESFFEEVDIGGTILQKALFSKDVMEADVLINMPKLKHHLITKITTGLKNMMGLVWDRGYFHSTNLNQAIAELAAYRKPELTIMDATKGIIARGPTGPGPIREWNQVIFGIDPIAVDAYTTQLYGLDPNEIDHLSAAAKLGFGEIDLQKVKIEKV